MNRKAEACGLMWLCGRMSPSSQWLYWNLVAVDRLLLHFCIFFDIFRPPLHVQFGIKVGFNLHTVQPACQVRKLARAENTEKHPDQIATWNQHIMGFQRTSNTDTLSGVTVLTNMLKTQLFMGQWKYIILQCTIIYWKSYYTNSWANDAVEDGEHSKLLLLKRLVVSVGFSAGRRGVWPSWMPPRCWCNAWMCRTVRRNVPRCRMGQSGDFHTSKVGCDVTFWLCGGYAYILYHIKSRHVLYNIN